MTELEILRGRLAAAEAGIEIITRERDEARAEVATLRRYSDGGLRAEPCGCGLVSLRWYTYCPRCGRRGASVRREPRVHTCDNCGIRRLSILGTPRGWVEGTRTVTEAGPGYSTTRPAAYCSKRCRDTAHDGPRDP